MTKTLLRFALPALLVALPLLASAGQGTPLNERRDAQTGGTVSITNVSGSVTVSPWSRSEVEVTGTLGQGSERLRFEVDGADTEIEVVLPGGRNTRVKGTDLIIRVPKGSSLEIAVVSAEVELEADADVEVACVSGNVTLTGSATDVEIAIVSGEAKVSLSGRLERAEVATVSGDITLSAPLADDGRIEIESISGDVHVSIPDDVGAKFALETFSGKLRNEMTNDRPEGGFGPGSELSFSTGGRARVRVQTFSGSVRLDAR